MLLYPLQVHLDFLGSTVKGVNIILHRVFGEGERGGDRIKTCCEVRYLVQGIYAI